MDLQTTLIILVAGLALTGFANWKSRQEYRPGELPLIPYNGLQFVGILVVFLMAAHLITLYTGQPFRGRFN